MTSPAIEQDPGRDLVEGTPPVVARASAAHRAARWAGTLLIVVGLLVLVWAFWVWRWGDPITGMYASWKQRQLSAAYEERERAFLAKLQAVPSGGAPSPARIGTGEALKALDRAATSYRSSASVGDADGRIEAPRMGLDAVIVEGTSSGVLKRGPGRDPRTYMPGQGELVYIAGHRTTYGAPFAHIDRMRPGDTIVLEFPYARLTYRVTGHRIVPADALEVLGSAGREQLALQACHPRFFATQRYIVDARLASFTMPTGNGRRTFSLGA
jgi:sortase A